MQTSLKIRLLFSHMPNFRLLEYSITSMENMMTPIFWSGVNSDLAAQIAFNFVCANWKRIYDRYANVEGQILMTIIDSAFGNVATEHELRQVNCFVLLDSFLLFNYFLMCSSRDLCEQIKSSCLAFLRRFTKTWNVPF